MDVVKWTQKLIEILGWLRWKFQFLLPYPIGCMTLRCALGWQEPHFSKKQWGLLRPALEGNGWHHQPNRLIDTASPKGEPFIDGGKILVNPKIQLFLDIFSAVIFGDLNPRHEKNPPFGWLNPGEFSWAVHPRPSHHEPRWKTILSNWKMWNVSHGMHASMSGDIEIFGRDLSSGHIWSYLAGGVK